MELILIVQTSRRTYNSFHCITKPLLTYSKSHALITVLMVFDNKKTSIFSRNKLLIQNRINLFGVKLLNFVFVGHMQA